MSPGARPHQAREHPGGPDTAAQGDQHGASIESGRLPGRRRSSRLATIAARHAGPPHPLGPPRTVVSVLREAALINGDVEASWSRPGRWTPRAA